MATYVAMYIYILHKIPECMLSIYLGDKLVIYVSVFHV